MAAPTDILVHGASVSFFPVTRAQESFSAIESLMFSHGRFLIAIQAAGHDEGSQAYQPRQAGANDMKGHLFSALRYRAALLG